MVSVLRICESVHYTVLRVLIALRSKAKAVSERKLLENSECKEKAVPTIK